MKIKSSTFCASLALIAITTVLPGQQATVNTTAALDPDLKVDQDRSGVAQIHFDGQTWWNHIKVLADDKLEGRDTGSRGERAAQAYAIEQLKSAGAETAGTNGFYQPVKFVSRQIVEKDCSLTLIRNDKDKREALTLGEDAIISTRVMPAPAV